MLNVINLILGGALLVAGRKLFWLFVGVAGFVTGVQLATRFAHGSDLTALIAGLVLGVIFALLAIFLQAVVIGIAGFLAGGYVLTVLATMLHLEAPGTISWIIYIIGGILGLILIAVLFDWALITLSSMAGAALIVQALFPQGTMGGLLFIVLFLGGVLFQGMLLRREKAVVVAD